MRRGACALSVPSMQTSAFTATLRLADLKSTRTARPFVPVATRSFSTSPFSQPAVAMLAPVQLMELTRADERKKEIGV